MDVHQTLDLAKMVPGAGGHERQGRLGDHARRPDYRINNQIGVTLPPLSLSVAPAGITSATGNPEARPLATLPATAAGVEHDRHGRPVPGRQAGLRGLCPGFQTPFNLIGSTTINLRSGTPTPRGKVDVTVTGTVTAAF